MSYENFSYYYDSLMDPQFYEDYEAFILKHVDFQNCMELGAGTGEIAIKLMKKGKFVLATDLSEDMLYIAKEKASSEKLKLPTQIVDMTNFLLNKPIECILCLCDSLNYVIEKEEVLQVFKNVYDSLEKNGTFVFDVNSMYKCNKILKNYHEESHEEDFDFVWHVESDEDGKVVHHVQINDKENNEQVDEIHHQKTYPVETYHELLQKAGFHQIELYSDFHEYKPNCERVIFVCRKGE